MILRPFVITCEKSISLWQNISVWGTNDTDRYWENDLCSGMLSASETNILESILFVEMKQKYFTQESSL